MSGQTQFIDLFCTCVGGKMRSQIKDETRRSFSQPLGQRIRLITLMDYAYNYTRPLKSRNLKIKAQ